MWFSPGLLVGAALVLIIYLTTGTASYWWVWLVAVVLASVIDTLLHIKKVEVPAPRTRTVYMKDDSE